MTTWPLKFREVDDSRLFFSDDAGGFFISDDGFLDRYVQGCTSSVDDAFLLGHGHAYRRIGDLEHTSFAYRWSVRQNARRALGYVILVPTLRCNLACSYCQVSRAPKNAVGFDWSNETKEATFAYLDQLEVEQIKVEFQGGEPLLRLDLLQEVRAFCRQRFLSSQFVVCTNLQDIGEAELEFLAAEDTYVSTSLDGSPELHREQRTKETASTARFFQNLKTVIDTLPAGHVSALPTIDPSRPPDFEGLIALYESFGLSSIYLRPINYQGFARRTAQTEDTLSRWNELHSSFIDHLIARNYSTGLSTEEFYFAHCLRRVLQAGHDGHVDIRNPTLFATDYVVVDYDGRLYPTDEARMLSRIGHVDLAVGDVASGIDDEAVAQLNGAALNNYDPDCIHCPYQPYCGTDLVDNLSRYSRVDMPRGDTWFCRRQLSVFDKIIRMIASPSEAEKQALSTWLGLNSWPSTLVPTHNDSTSP